MSVEKWLPILTYNGYVDWETTKEKQKELVPY